MGLGDPLAADAEKRIPNFNYYTRLALEMKICKEYLGGKPHSYFKKLNKEDQTKLLLYEKWERERSIKQEKIYELERKKDQLERDAKGK